MKTPITILAGLGVLVAPWLQAQDTATEVAGTATLETTDPEVTTPPLDVASLRERSVLTWAGIATEPVAAPEPQDPREPTWNISFEAPPEPEAVTITAAIDPRDPTWIRLAPEPTAPETVQEPVVPEAGIHLRRSRLSAAQAARLAQDDLATELDRLRARVVEGQGELEAAEAHLRAMELMAAQDPEGLEGAWHQQRQRLAELQAAEALAQAEAAAIALDQRARSRALRGRVVDPQGVPIRARVAETAELWARPTAESVPTILDGSASGSGVTVIVENGDVHIYNGANGPSLRATGGLTISHGPSCEPQRERLDRRRIGRERELLRNAHEERIRSFLERQQEVEEEAAARDNSVSAAEAEYVDTVLQLRDLANAERYDLVAAEDEYLRLIAETGAVAEPNPFDRVDAAPEEAELADLSLQLRAMELAELEAQLDAETSALDAADSAIERLRTEETALLEEANRRSLERVDVRHVQAQADEVMQEMHDLMAQMHAELHALRQELAEISDEVGRAPARGRSGR